MRGHLPNELDVIGRLIGLRVQLGLLLELGRVHGHDHHLPAKHHDELAPGDLAEAGVAQVQLVSTLADATAKAKGTV